MSAVAVRRALPLAALALIAAVPAVPSVAPGYRFTYKVTSDQRGAQPQTAVSQVAGGKLRMDWTQGGMSAEMRGAYMVMDAEAGRMLMVNPKDKQVIVMDAETMGGMAQLAGGMVRMELQDPTLDVEDLGAGGTILGHATRRYKVTQTFTMKMTMMGRTSTTPTTSVQEVWITRDVLGYDKAFEQWGDRFGKGFGTFGGAVQGDGWKQLMELSRQKWPKGFPLKTVTTSTSADPRDPSKTTTSTTTMEITEWAKADIDASVFAIPAGYQTVDLAAQMKAVQDEMRKAGVAPANAGSGQAGDPLSAGAIADSAKKAAKEETKDQAKNAAKDAVRGLFRRKP
jgi:hypothetical protein